MNALALTPADTLSAVVFDRRVRLGSAPGRVGGGGVSTGVLSAGSGSSGIGHFGKPATNSASQLFFVRHRAVFTSNHRPSSPRLFHLGKATVP